MAPSTSASRLVIAAAALAEAPGVASADPLRLRGDALATAETPAGLFALEAHDGERPWLDAECAVWFGADTGEDDGAATGDALVVVVELIDPRKRGRVRLGRQVVVTGALRPMHLDGAAGRVHLPGQVDVEVFGGLPVVPKFGPRPWDWLVGGRASRAIGEAKVGVAWMQRRDYGELHTHEVAADAAMPVGARIDLAAGAALDVISLGLAEAKASATFRRGWGRIEGFATHRSIQHLLPATSLFSVLGDSPATRLGASARWRAAPRLDVDGTAALRVIGDDVAEDLEAGTRLRLDDRGASSLGLQLRRQGAPDGGWTGVRGTGRLALTDTCTASAELELAAPDDDDGDGAVWPWALGAIAWRPTSAWELAAAAEASATPQYTSRVDVLVRVSRTWEAR